MLEAIQRVIDYLFTQTSITEVYAFVRTDNKQSQRVLEKAGFSLSKSKAKQEIMKNLPVVLDRWAINKLDFSR